MAVIPPVILLPILGALLQWFVAKKTNKQTKDLISTSWLAGGTELLVAQVGTDQPPSGAGLGGSLVKSQEGMSCFVSSPGRGHVWLCDGNGQEF